MARTLDSAQAMDMSQPNGFGFDAGLTRLETTDRVSGERIVDLDLMFRLGNYLVGVRIVDATNREPMREEVRRAAGLLRDRLLAAADAPLSAGISEIPLRFDGRQVAPIPDGLHM
ncbi:MAG: hypothetical protein IT337_04500 [Thermomicrobiales bacterium]|nr:hypothetical protein [Thermomicrobiales bacterium]